MGTIYIGEFLVGRAGLEKGYVAGEGGRKTGGSKQGRKGRKGRKIVGTGN